MTKLIAYHGNEAEKQATLEQLREHRRLDQIVQGLYWDGNNGDGKGCAVGCLTHDPAGGHARFPELWGIPVQIAHLIDHVFECLPIDEAKDWPLRIMSAISAGADLSPVYDRWSLWMLRRLVEAATAAGVKVPEVEVMASLFERAVSGDEPPEAEWSWAARAARAAEAAWAARAAWAAEAARAAWAAEAAWAAWAAWAASREEWGRAAADELVGLVSVLSPVGAEG